MARDEFDNAGSFVAIRDFENKLVLFTPTSYIESMETTFGDTDAIVTDVVVLDEDGQPEYPDVMVFQGALIGTLKRKLSYENTIERDPVSGVVTKYQTTTTRRVLGVIKKGEAKKNQSAPFILEAADEAQKDVARAYVKANPLPAPVKVQIGQSVELGNQFVTAPAQGESPSFTPSPAPAVSQVAEDPFATPRSADAQDDPFAA